MITFCSLLAIGQTVIPLKKQGKTYTVPCKINGHLVYANLNAVHSFFEISEEYALKLITDGIIQNNDLADADSASTDLVIDTLANRQRVKTQYALVSITKMEFGGIKLTGIHALVNHDLNAPPLNIGNELLKIMGKFEIDTIGKKLTIYNDTNNYNYYTYVNKLFGLDSNYNFDTSYSDQWDGDTSYVDSTIYKQYELLVAALTAYNEGAGNYNNQNYYRAIDKMKKTLEIYNMDNGHIFDGYPDKTPLDTAAAEATMTLAISYYQLGKYDDALPYLQAAKKNPLTSNITIYQYLIEVSRKSGNAAATMGLIHEARKVFPDNQIIRNYELNTIIADGSPTEIAKKMEEALEKTPEDTLLLYNLATTYLQMALPTFGDPPSNFEELIAKSEATFQRLLKIRPDNATYNYNFGSLYYNQAVQINSKMANISGSSYEDNRKREELKSKRDILFGKTIPLMEQVYYGLIRYEKTLSKEDHNTYEHAIKALSIMYPLLGEPSKGLMMKQKYNKISR